MGICSKAHAFRQSNQSFNRSKRKQDCWYRRKNFVKNSDGGLKPYNHSIIEISKKSQNLENILFKTFFLHIDFFAIVWHVLFEYFFTKIVLHISSILRKQSLQVIMFLVSDSQKWQSETIRAAFSEHDFARI